MSLSPGSRVRTYEAIALVGAGGSGVHDVGPDGRFLIVENTTPDDQAESIRVIVSRQSLAPQAQ